ncbi:hypothetical protein O3P69_017715 [Scylla paramamosain]|uniref:Uncharacterized protein n=1 Tax=Scylla paramamosain TaxID=85552 RepID=A0AAW0U0C3_SCYPA
MYPHIWPWSQTGQVTGTLVTGAVTPQVTQIPGASTTRLFMPRCSQVMCIRRQVSAGRRDELPGAVVVPGEGGATRVLLPDTSQPLSPSVSQLLNPPSPHRVFPSHPLRRRFVTPHTLLQRGGDVLSRVVEVVKEICCSGVSARLISRASTTQGPQAKDTGITAMHSGINYAQLLPLPGAAQEGENEAFTDAFITLADHER